MTRVIVRRDPLTVISDDHRRIRRLEAEPSTGGSGGDCPDCVLDPFTVNPGDITVPPALRGCVDIAGLGAGGPSEFLSTCGSSPITSLFTGAPLGFCSYIGLGKPLGLQIRVNTALGGNISNIIVYAGTVESQVYATGWDPGESPATFDSGWVDIDAGLCSFASCAPITLGATFAPHNTFFGSCVGPGIVAARYVVLDDEGNFRGALDDLPQGSAFGDTLYFSTDTHSFVEGPRSVPSRAMATFMGG